MISKRRLAALCTLAGAAGWFAVSCGDNPTVPKKAAEPQGTQPQFATVDPFNGGGACFGQDAVTYRKRVSGMSTDPLSLNCTAEDIKVAEAVATNARVPDPSQPGSFIDVDPRTTPVTCLKGDSITLTLQLDIDQSASSERQDIGLWLATDGGAALVGACNHYNIPAGTPGTTNLDGDKCAGMAVGATASLNIGTLKVACVDTDDDQKLDVGNCTSWKTPSDDLTCPDDASGDGGGANFESGQDYRAGTLPSNKAKCNCSRFPVNITVVENPDISIVKTADAGSVSAGTDIGFTLTVSNASGTNIGAASNVAITDTLPDGGLSWSVSPSVNGCSIALDNNISKQVLSCTVGTLNAGGSFAVHVTSATDKNDCKVVDNRGWADASNDDPVSDTARTTVICPNLSIVKTADAGTVSAGDSIGFTLTVSNSGAAGTGTATGVVVTDTLPDSGLSFAERPDKTECAIASGVLTCTVGDLAPGGSFSVHVKSATDKDDCKVVDNTGYVSATNAAGGSDTARVTVQCAALSIVKTADAGTVSAGDSIGYTLTVSNSNAAGTGTATGVVVTDTFPAGFGFVEAPDKTECTIASGVLTCTVGDLAPGGSFSVHVKSATDQADCKVVDNTGRVSAANAGGASDTARVTVQCPDLSIVKTADAGTVSAGDSIGFTLTASNSGAAGTGTAKGVVVTDTFPNSGLSFAERPDKTECSITSGVLTCTVGDLAPGGSFSVHVKSATTAATCRVVDNKGYADASNDDPVSDTARTTVQCPNLTLTKTPDKSGDTGFSVVAGDSAKFTIAVSNSSAAGTGTAKNVVLTDTLPDSGLNWVESPDKAQCSIALNNTISRQVLSCSVGDLAPGGSFTVVVATLVPSTYVQLPPAQGVTPLEIDGNLLGGNDWDAIGIRCTTPIDGCDLDVETGVSDNSFGKGTAEDKEVPSVVTGSIPNNKSDLLRFYVNTARVGTDNLLYLAWERVQAPKGTTNMDFELNQDTALSSNGVTPKRTAGDILVKYDLSNGGTVPTLGFHRWVTAASAAAGGLGSASAACEASNSFPCWGKAKLLGTVNDTVAGAVNPDTTTDPIDPDAPRMLDALTFGEARINLQKSGIFAAGTCVSFGRAYLKSRSSDAFTSEIKDFIKPIPVSVTNCENKDLKNNAVVKADNVSPALADSGYIHITSGGSALLLTEPSGFRLARADADTRPAAGLLAVAMRTPEVVGRPEDGVEAPSKDSN